MNVLFFGDIVGRPGREAIKKILPDLKKRFEPDLIIANGENLAHGMGLSTKTVQEMFEIDIDVLTGGNHSFHNEDGLKVLTNKNLPVIRPMNYPTNMPGRGFIELNVKNQLVIIFNLIGQVFMKDEVENPFVKTQEFIKSQNEQPTSRGVKIIILDWHAEATSEKIAMGQLVDGQISAVLGTHTHTPTSDWQILPKGTGFVSDVGMCGVKDSIIGMEKSSILNGFLTGENVKFEVAEGPVMVNAIALTIDDETGLTSKIYKIQELVN